MSDWKLRQKMYHFMNPVSEIGDSLENEIIVEEWDPSIIVNRAIEYLVKDSRTLYYPGKAYAIAIIYSQMLVLHFGGNFLDYLSDPDLLFGNDPYFVPYAQSKEVYDQILKQINIEDISGRKNLSPNALLTLGYFKKEFYLDESDGTHGLFEKF